MRHESIPFNKDPRHCREPKCLVNSVGQVTKTKLDNSNCIRMKAGSQAGLFMMDFLSRQLTCLIQAPYTALHRSTVNCPNIPSKAVLVNATTEICCAGSTNQE